MKKMLIKQLLNMNHTQMIASKRIADLLKRINLFAIIKKEKKVTNSLWQKVLSALL